MVGWCSMGTFNDPAILPVPHQELSVCLNSLSPHWNPAICNPETPEHIFFNILFEEVEAKARIPQGMDEFFDSKWMGLWIEMGFWIRISKVSSLHLGRFIPATSYPRHSWTHPFWVFEEIWTGTCVGARVQLGSYIYYFILGGAVQIGNSWVSNKNSKNS